MINYDFIATDRPINKTTGIVLQKGEHFKEPEYTNLFKAPLPVKKYNGEKNLTGKRFYRFTVIGFTGENGQGKSRWLLRCDCGNYTVRSRKSIKKIKKNNGKCSQCSYLDYIKSVKYKERFIKKRR